MKIWELQCETIYEIWVWTTKDLDILFENVFAIAQGITDWIYLTHWHQSDAYVIMKQ